MMPPIIYQFSFFSEFFFVAITFLIAINRQDPEEELGD